MFLALAAFALVAPFVTLNGGPTQLTGLDMLGIRGFAQLAAMVAAMSLLSVSLGLGIMSGWQRHKGWLIAAGAACTVVLLSLWSSALHYSSGWLSVGLVICELAGITCAALTTARRNTWCTVMAGVGIVLLATLGITEVHVTAPADPALGWGVIYAAVCLSAAAGLNIWERVPAHVRIDMEIRSEYSEAEVGASADIVALLRAPLYVPLDAHGDFSIRTIRTAHGSFRAGGGYTDQNHLAAGSAGTSAVRVQAKRAMAYMAKHGISALALNHGTADARLIEFSEVPELHRLPLADPLGLATETSIPAMPDGSAVVQLAATPRDSRAAAQEQRVASAAARPPRIAWRVGRLLRTFIALALVALIEAAGFIALLLIEALHLMANALLWTLWLLSGPFFLAAAGMVAAWRRGSAAINKQAHHPDTTPFRERPIVTARLNPIKRARASSTAQRAYQRLRDYEASGEESQLGEALAAARLASRYPMRRSVVHFAWYTVGRSLQHKYEKEEAADQLDAAVSAFIAARDNFGEWWMPRTERLVRRLLPLELGDVRLALGDALLDRYASRGDEADLAQAVVEIEAAVLDERLRQPAVALIHLSRAYIVRYERTGALIDAELALDAVREAGKTMPSVDDATKAALSAFTCFLLLVRYEIEGASADLTTALKIVKDLESSTPHSDVLPHALLILIVARARCLAYESTISQRRGATEVARARRLANERKIKRRRGAVETADRRLGEALEANVAPGWSIKADLMLERASCLMLLGGNERSATAHALVTEALWLMPPGCPDRGRALLMLGRTILGKDAVASEAEARARASHCFAAACESARESAPYIALLAALEWEKVAQSDDDLVAVAAACRAGMETIVPLVATQLLREHGETWLRRGQRLATEGAFALAMTRRADEAVEVLEAGRLLLFSDALGDDLPLLQELRSLGHDELAERLAETTREFRDAMRVDVAGRTVSRKERAARMRRARQHLAAVLAVIHETAATERASLPLSIGDVFSLATACPIVYVVAARRGGVALLVNQSAARVEPIELPGVVTSVVSDMASAHLAASKFAIASSDWESALDTTTCWLWQHIMQPILERAPGARRIVVIPTGQLSLLPLHAAIWNERPSTTDQLVGALSEGVCVTYAPSARALRLVRRHRPVEGAEETLLVYAQEPQKARAEVLSIAARLAVRHEIIHPPIDHQRLLQELPGWPVVHIACHATADLDNPLSSGIDLGSGSITVRDLLQCQLDRAALVILSACETSWPGLDLADEVISLPLALMQAGVRGVIASMWDVPDVGTALVMARFHDLWPDAIPAASEALRQAQLWVRDATNGEHEGRFPIIFETVVGDTDEALHEIWRHRHHRAHPSNWAGFTYIGA
jgi:CHAT domain-containing protein